MEPILGIDLGTTNSVVSIIQEGAPRTFRDARGRATLPSVVGIDHSGRLLVGEEARNQALVAPERTVRSIKRKMGLDTRVGMGEGSFSPQEISAMILRTLAELAEQNFGQKLTKAVITVPAFFKDAQREATREAGTLAGLEVLRIINEPTAASLVYTPKSTKQETLLVYDLGGGTFDVSIVRMEADVIEVLSSHGDTHLGGDDFDQLLLNFIADAFLEEHGVDLRKIPIAHARLLRAAEDAKIRLSSEPFTTVAEEFIAEKNGQPLNLNMTIDRGDYEQLILPLLEKTLRSVDAALDDAKLTAQQLDRVILVGGSTRTPLVHQLLRRQLHHELHHEIDPDLCVSMGAAVQGALIAGLDVGPILVDITPHTLGVSCIGSIDGQLVEDYFSIIIDRNTPLPVSRSQVYGTASDGQEKALIQVYQGENAMARFNQLVGKVLLDGLDREAEIGNEVVVRFDLDLNGILKVRAQERQTGLFEELVIDNAITQFRAKNQTEAKQRLSSLFGGTSESMSNAAGGDVLTVAASAYVEEEESTEAVKLAVRSLSLAQAAISKVNDQDARELNSLMEQLQVALEQENELKLNAVREQLDDLLFYLQDV